MCHIKTGFVLLVAVTLSLSVIYFVYDFSLNPVKDRHNWFNLLNQSYNVVTEGLSGKKNVWNFLIKQQTIQTTTTMEKPSASISTLAQNTYEFTNMQHCTTLQAI